MKSRKLLNLSALFSTLLLGSTVVGEPAIAKELALNIHLMHPGDDSAPGDPNAAFYLDDTYHLHYILRHDWNGEDSFSFIHVTSSDMLNWKWQPTTLQPSFTGHGMFSGTGFLTKEGMPAIIYHGKDSVPDRNQILIAKDRQLSAWEKPYPIDSVMENGDSVDMRHWDPDCFLIGDTYYAISGGKNPQLIKSNDLRHWMHVGDFFQKELPGVVLGEDLSCANFFQLDGKWVLLCISHPMGARYYIGDWDYAKEQFVPESHGRMNWRRKDQPLDELAWDFFAPESLLAADGRRVMWSWCARPNKQIRWRTIQSLPRELSIDGDGVLRMQPIRELAGLRRNLRTFSKFEVELGEKNFGGTATKRIMDLPESQGAYEIRAVIKRSEAERKRFGFRFFSNDKREGLPVQFLPEYEKILVGQTEAPFAVSKLPLSEDVELRIFVDRYMVEVFVNGRQALYAADMDWREGSGFDAYTFGASTVFEKIEVWELEPTNEGFIDALEEPIWKPMTGSGQLD